ncbi:MAG TPA: hypothetical protein VGQ46_19000 [Thermoanaerobaculia bacterium]|jgi:hypothetical protein|nr:hypothetical protein [Thermoanaerobaculia bacterium]
MRTALPLLLIVATSVFAQEQRDPKTLHDAERANDTLTARRAFDASARAMLTPKYRDVIEHYAPSATDLQATWGEFIAADGMPFIALQIAPAPAAVKADERITFFGLVTDENGKTIATFNEPQSVVASNADLFVERTLTLPLRKSRGTFGLARRNDVIGLARIDFDPEPLTAAGSGISRVIVSSDVHVLPTAQAPLDPFAFGGTKVVPKPGASFKRSEEVWLFTELRNPSLGADAAPRVTTKLELEGSAKSIPGSPVAAEATPLKGVPGHFGIGSTIDVTSLPPGDYKVRLTVTDTIAKQAYKRETMIHIR